MASSECRVIESICDPEEIDSSVTIACHGSRICIDITADNLQSSAVKERYLEIVQDGEFDLAEQLDGTTDFLPSDVILDEELCVEVDCFEPSEVMICAENAEDALSRPPGKVKTDDNQIHFFKAYRLGANDVATREVSTYLEIQRADLEGLPIPKLNGLVRDKTGGVFGLLLTYIETNMPTMQHVLNGSDPPDELRRSWWEQISEATDSLHSAGIVWGDVKPQNVLIDTQDNAWMIDFGGLCDDTWVDEELTGTEDGDLQGLDRLYDHMDL